MFGVLKDGAVPRKRKPRPDPDRHRWSPATGEAALAYGEHGFESVLCGRCGVILPSKDGVVLDGWEGYDEMGCCGLAVHEVMSE